MADCRVLIRMAGMLRWIFGGMTLILAGTEVLFRRRAAFADGVLGGLGAAGILCTGLLVWALIDFDGLFTAFHRLAFTNDGWLLDPRTDLLIRLMPTDFFTALGARLLLWMIAAAAAAGIAAWILRKGGAGSSPRDSGQRRKFQL